MSLARGMSLVKQVTRMTKPFGATSQQIRESGGLYSYRTGAYPPTNFQKYGAEILSGFMWWWILYHIYTEPDHLLGEFPWPDSKKWTDEELGIPSDDLD